MYLVFYKRTRACTWGDEWIWCLLIWDSGAGGAGMQCWLQSAGLKDPYPIICYVIYIPVIMQVISWDCQIFFIFPFQGDQLWASCKPLMGDRLHTQNFLSCFCTYVWGRNLDAVLNGHSKLPRGNLCCEIEGKTLWISSLSTAWCVGITVVG